MQFNGRLKVGNTHRRESPKTRTVNWNVKCYTHTHTRARTFVCNCKLCGKRKFIENIFDADAGQGESRVKCVAGDARRLLYFIYGSVEGQENLQAPVCMLCQIGSPYAKVTGKRRHLTHTHTHTLTTTHNWKTLIKCSRVWKRANVSPISFWPSHCCFKCSP